jgi:hypothetical protein
MAIDLSHFLLTTNDAPPTNSLPLLSRKNGKNKYTCLKRKKQPNY